MQILKISGGNAPNAPPGCATDWVCSETLAILKFCTNTKKNKMQRSKSTHGSGKATPIMTTQLWPRPMKALLVHWKLTSSLRQKNGEKVMLREKA